MKIERYKAYRESGIEWLGKVPEHWGLFRIKTLTTTKSGTTPQSGLSQYYENGTHFWVRTTDLNNNKLYSSEFKVTDLAREDYNLTTIPIKSILLAMYGGMGTIGKNAIVLEEVTINQSVCAIFPNNKKFFSEYLWYYIQYFRPHWEIFADSARKDPNINQEVIKRLWVTLPSILEQKAIAHYLDTKTDQIDRKINLLTQKAALYGDLKQSLINETVTRGLDKSVSVKDSGIEWLGEVPEHWEIRHFKQFSTMKGRIGWQGLKHSEFIDEGPFLITGMNFKGGKIRWDEVYHITNERYEQAPEIQLKENDILMTKDGTIGKLLYVDSIPFPHKASLNSHLLVFRPIRKSFHPKYLYYQLDSSAFQDYVEIAKAGTTFFGISQAAVGRYIAIIPPLSEQKAIADYLDTQTAQIDQIIQIINTQIEKLKELRKTLINDVVTGKIKVV